jgi:hypothetical protein
VVRCKAQKRQIQASFKEGAAKHVEELKEALQQQRDQNDRLECQKQLLLKQVRSWKPFETAS